MDAARPSSFSSPFADRAAVPFAPSSKDASQPELADRAGGRPVPFALSSKDASKPDFADRAGGNHVLFACSSKVASKPVVADAEADADNRSTRQRSVSPECSSAGNPSPRGSSAGKPLCDNPSPKGSCTDSGSCSSSVKVFDKKAVSVKPTLMKKPGSTVVVKKCTKSASGITISVSHTEKETIVHTDCSNFREVVHRLTGASRSNDALLPVTMPSRARGNVDDASGCLPRHDASSRGPHRMASRLFERRRSSKALERISTSCKDLPPLVPSPVTPLASDFDRICLPVTPVASPSFGQKNESSKHISPAKTPLNKFGRAQSYSTNRQPGLNMCVGSDESLLMPANPQPIECRSQFAVHASCSNGQQGKSFEDLVIAEKGFFLHPHMPRTSEPALLSLFPESPRDL